MAREQHSWQRHQSQSHKHICDAASHQDRGDLQSWGWRGKAELTWLCEWSDPETEHQPESGAGCTAAACVSTAAAPAGTAAAAGHAAPATAHASYPASCGRTCLCCRPGCHCNRTQMTLSLPQLSPASIHVTMQTGMSQGGFA